MQIIQCKVEKIEALTETIKRIVLIPDSSINFIAGQYLQIMMGDDDKRPFSIANAPREDGSIELHIGAEPGNHYSGQVLDKMHKDKYVSVEGGLGQAFLNQADAQATILLAGGTGFSYVYSILQQMLSQPLQAPVIVYWGTRTLNDMYAFEELKTLADQHPLFTFVPVIELPEKEWAGKTGWVHQAVLDDIPDLSTYQVYVAGRFEMAKVVRDDFTKHGLPLSNLFGDAYAFI
ncbi:NAD(P)H-flavin reductase [uncultured Paraglaciecola sp.]|uniref:NAD(P)H-flavin reductase n=1 Tax=uncultured Paraglaciecola sp. TaxID=1765024 RepID=UPI0030DD8D0A|tara:strand:+ start:11524 stop:12222 length:699 start_codon:yes stop_codon:yes gene_type:complete